VESIAGGPLRSTWVSLHSYEKGTVIKLRSHKGRDGLRMTRDKHVLRFLRTTWNMWLTLLYIPDVILKRRINGARLSIGTRLQHKNLKTFRQQFWKTELLGQQTDTHSVHKKHLVSFLHFTVGSYWFLLPLSFQVADRPLWVSLRLLEVVYPLATRCLMVIKKTTHHGQ